MQKLSVFGVLLLFQACNPRLQSTMSESPKFVNASEPVHAASTQAKFNLNDHQWQHRVLLIFAPSEQSAEYQQQMQRFKTLNAETNDRDLKLVQVFSSGESRVDNSLIALASVAQLRKQFDIKPEDFAVILVGKDGDEKQRSTKPVDPTAIFRTIDAMPMRQQEMRHN